MSKPNLLLLIALAAAALPVGVIVAQDAAETPPPAGSLSQDGSYTLESPVLASYPSDAWVFMDPAYGESPESANPPAAAKPAGPPPGPSPAQKKALAKAAAGAYKGVFYDNNFNYLYHQAYHDWHLGESLKRRCLGDCIEYDFGGEYRARAHSENNMRGLGLTGRDDDFLLHRTRLYLNADVGNSLRFYGEVIDAVSNYENFRPRLIEENRSDVLNLFADGKLFENYRGELWGRIGRQELLYGVERTVSPLDWANTRRTFDGVKLLWKGANWDVDAFWAQPVVPNTRHFDNPVSSRDFVGIYSKYKKLKNQTLEAYFLRLSETRAPARATNFDFNTFGARWLGQRCLWLCELEAAYQCGEFGTANHSAWAYTLGFGRKCPNLAWKPTLWAYFDWAQGNPIQGNGYHHLFPLSHKYLGYMDFFGRRNVEDVNFLVTLQPRENVKLLFWWHVLFLENGLDVPYTVGMTPTVPVPGGSEYLGQEVDLTAAWTITPRMHLLLGYSHFFTGDFYRTNPSPGLFTGDADFFYAQFGVRF
ncbi:MAG: alginate export family protein [Planctomycetota bacterium]|jgi:hypothetical protein